MTFASADPKAARQFVVTYLGGSYEITSIDPECYHIEWVNLSHTAGTHLAFELHFVKDWRYANGGMTIHQFEDKMAKLHGALTSFDGSMDYHLTVATDDVDPVALKLVADKKPLLVRKFNGNYSLFVEVPHGIMLEIVSSKLTVLKPKIWNRCGTPQRPDLNFDAAFESASDDGISALPPMYPIRAVYASTSPSADADFFVNHFGGKRISDRELVENALGAGNGTCYEVQAVRLQSISALPVTGITEFELWWIYSPYLRQGNYTVRQHEKFLKAVHSNISKEYDAYMDSHVGLWYHQSDSFIESLWRERIPFFSSGTFGAGPRGQVSYTGLFLQGPAGQVYEWLALNQTLLPRTPTWPQLLCNGSAAPRHVTISI